MVPFAGLLAALQEMPDPRRRQGQRYSLVPLLLFSVLAVASVFVFRRRPNWQKLRAVNFLFPLIPVAYILVGTGMVVWGIIFQPTVSLASLGTIAVGAAVYHMTRKGKIAAEISQI